MVMMMLVKMVIMMVIMTIVLDILMMVMTMVMMFEKIKILIGRKKRLAKALCLVISIDIKEFLKRCSNPDGWYKADDTHTSYLSIWYTTALFRPVKVHQ